MAQVNDLARAIQRFENVNPAYNNPGGIWNASTNSIRSYSSFDEGWAALLHTVNNYVGQGYTLEGMMARYAPAGHGSNDPGHYADVLGEWLGVPTNVPLNQVLGSSTVDTTMIPTPTTIDEIVGSGVDAVFGTTVIGEGVEVPNWLIVGVGVGALIWWLRS